MARYKKASSCCKIIRCWTAVGQEEGQYECSLCWLDSPWSAYFETSSASDLPRNNAYFVSSWPYGHELIFFVFLSSLLEGISLPKRPRRHPRVLCGGRELLEGAILCSLDLVLNKDPLHCGVEREGRVYGMEFISLGSQAFVRSRMALVEKPMVIPNNNAMMTATTEETAHLGNCLRNTYFQMRIWYVVHCHIAQRLKVWSYWWMDCWKKM